MRGSIQRDVPLAAVAALVILGGALLTLTACNGEEADDWVVVHQNRLCSPSQPGGLIDTIDVPAGKEVVWLPTCMRIEKGDKIGFANYYNDVGAAGSKITIELDPAIFKVAKFDLAYQETKIVEVIATPTTMTEPNIKLAGAPHGGPAMIPVEPPGP